MYPELFGFIKSYGLMLSLSFVLGIWLSLRRGKARGIPPNTVMDICFGVMVSSLIGVRLFFVLTHWELYDDWYRVFFIWDGGLTLHGGIILATLTVWWLARRRGIPFLQIADVLSPSVVLGVGLTRIGCFLAGCCFGTPTDFSLAVHFPPTCRAGSLFPGEEVHPAQLYSSAAGFVLFGLLLWLERRSDPTGATFARFLLLYGVVRFVLEFTRYVEPSQVWALSLSNTQWISLVAAVSGAVLLTGLTLRRR
jgi:phosphatidylglycerol:prolipoprotein diacylglycerol transferase